ncbi:MAG TPA: hypothetical protein VH592_20540, partial [Gemmataceae bacterium]
RLVGQTSLRGLPDQPTAFLPCKYCNPDAARLLLLLIKERCSGSNESERNPVRDGKRDSKGGGIILHNPCMQSASAFHTPRENKSEK